MYSSFLDEFYEYRATAAAVTSLQTEQGKQITECRHNPCPGHAVPLSGSPDDVHQVTVCLVGGPTGTATAGSSGSGHGPLSEEQKAARRQVREHNAAWRSAQTVRRNWLAQFLPQESTQGWCRLVSG